MTPEQLRIVLAEAATSIIGVVPSVDGAPLRRGGQGPSGDWQSALALRTGSPSPQALAARIAEVVRPHPGIASVTVTGPGFLTVTIETACLLAAAAEIAVVHSASGPTASDHAAIDGAASDQGSGEPGVSELPAEAVGRIQHAHAHGRRLLRLAAAAGMRPAVCDPADGPGIAAGPLAEVELDAAERDLLLRVLEVDDLIARTDGDPPRVLPTAVAELAACHLEWAGTHVLVPTVDADITALHAARLVLVSAVTMVLHRGLRRLGACAPERM